MVDVRGAIVTVDVFLVKYLSNHYFNNFVVYKHVSVFIQTFSRYERHDIDVSIDVITLKALQCTNSKILIALMTLMLRNELYLSRIHEE